MVRRGAGRSTHLLELGHYELDSERNECRRSEGLFQIALHPIDIAQV